jgi:tetratricopeptide (TPR) repeat protein
MFDQFSIRYRGSDLGGRPVHAHNDWLQLLIEYGRIGLGMGVLFFAVHLAAGWRNALRVARESLSTGWWPQGTGLGLLSGSLAALVAQSVHSFFDYRLHLAPVVFLAAASAGWLAGVRTDDDRSFGQPSSWWMRLLAIMPAVPGAVLVWWVAQELPAEKRALQLENAVLRGDVSAAADLLDADADQAPNNPRYLAIAAEAAWIESTRAESLVDAVNWRSQCVAYWEKYLPLRPWTAEAMRGYASVRASRGEFRKALPFYLRGIALDPNSAPGYEYLAIGLWTEKRYAEAARLLRLSRTLPGAEVPPVKITEIENYLRGSGP